VIIAGPQARQGQSHISNTSEAEGGEEAMMEVLAGLVGLAIAGYLVIQVIRAIAEFVNGLEGRDDDGTP
jgi:hypothetical protein